MGGRSFDDFLMTLLEVSASLADAWICPACRTPLRLKRLDPMRCSGCERSYPRAAGMLDLRLKSDRYLDLRAERAKAERLAAYEDRHSATELARIYYEMTFDVDDRRRDRFLAHVNRAEARGETLLRSLPRTGRILEIGCGTGGLLVAARQAGRDIVGVDIASRWLVIARRRLRELGFRAPLIAADAEALPWAEGSFDVVVADSLLEHIGYRSQTFAEIRRVLRPGGAFVAWSPNRLAVTPDPHVGLWGIGLLPKRLRPIYARLLRGCDWTVDPLSAVEARTEARAAGLENVEIGVPDASRAWARSVREQAALALYSKMRRYSPTRRLLERFGPLWELKAIRGEGGSSSTHRCDRPRGSIERDAWEISRC